MAKKSQAIVNKRNSVFSVRLSAEVHAGLKKAAERNGRTLMGEMEGRLAESLGDRADAIDPAAYGWSSPEPAQALGAALGVLAGHIFDYSAPLAGDQVRPKALAMMRVAFDEILVALGSGQIEEAEKLLARGAATSFLRDLERVVPDPSEYRARPELAVVAALKKAFDPGANA